MPIPTWIRDFLGIRKDFVETRKAVLEIAKLEDEERERDFLIRASMSDIEKYDPNTQLLLKKIAEDRIERARKEAETAEVQAYCTPDDILAALDILRRLEALAGSGESRIF